MMEPQSLQQIIAASATKRLELAGGSTLGQALPEDYVLSNFLLRALEERNGQELEFALKSYLRIHVVPLPSEDSCFLVEPLGFILNIGVNSGTIGTESLISSRESRVRIFVIPTDEDRMIYKETVRIISAED